MSKTRQNITAIIYNKRGDVLSIGKNDYIKTHPMQAHHAKLVGEAYKVYLHAEVAAIIRCKDLSKAHRILITRTGNDGKTMLAAPCAICLSALKAAGIFNIEHT